jgi:hypothetical protein
MTGAPTACSGATSRVRTALQQVDRAGRALWPSLFAYQYVAVLRQDPAWAPLEERPVRSGTERLAS